MTKTETKQHAKVRPSSRDPITTWLEVFTKLLAVPPAERLRIRDELEDHLRMRVDDLLILGMTEPEAVQKAVTELGETAELAKRFKEARTNPRRRILMHTALFTVAGLALTLSIVGMNPPANHSMNPADSQGIASVQPENADISSHPRLEFDLEAGPLNEVLAQLAEFAGTRLFVHWGSLGEAGLDSESEVAAIPSKGLEMNKVRQLLNSALGLEGLDQITGSFEDGLMEIGTQRYFDRQSIITLDHDVSALVPADHILEFTDEASNLRDGIMMVIEPDIWIGRQSFGAIAINGPQLSVRAPERVQTQIIDYIERLRHSQQQDESRKQRQRTEQVKSAENEAQQAIERLEMNKRKLAREIAELEAELPEINRMYWASEYEIKEVDVEYHMNGDHESRAALRTRLVDLRTQHDSVTNSREQLKNALLARRGQLSNIAENQLALSLYGGQ